VSLITSEDDIGQLALYTDAPERQAGFLEKPVI
jgi:hypothetical protein